MGRIATLIAAGLWVVSGAAWAAPRLTVMLTDTSSLRVDAGLRARVVRDLSAALEQHEGWHVIAPTARGDGGRTDIGRLMSRARALSRAFKEAQAQGTLQQAEELFRKLFGHDPSIDQLVQIYLARARLHHDLGEEQARKRYLSRAIVLVPERRLDPGAHPPGLVRRWRRLAALLHGQRGTLEVGTRPPGLTVWVDGKRRGRAPLSLELMAGEHFVAAGYPGATTGRAVQVPAAGQTSAEIALPERRRPSDETMRSIGREAGAHWIVTVDVVEHPGARVRVKLGALATRTVDLPRKLASPRVGRDRLTWAVSQLAVRLRSALQPGRPGARTERAHPTDRVAPSERGSGSILTSWWFWTVVGVVAAGGAAAAIVVTTRDDPGVQLTLSR